jgi:penicillin-insensitive murein DD-endopeptidase
MLAACRTLRHALAAGLSGMLAACGASGGSETPAAPSHAAAEPSATTVAATPDDEAPAQIDEPAIPGGGPDPMTLGPEVSASIGGPSDGRLDGGVPLPLHGPGYRFDPRKSPERRHGTVELVQALIRAAASVHERLPGNELTIGDLSMRKGGTIAGHASHQSGRDVDVMFYLLDDEGQPFGGKPIPLEPDGTGHDYNDLADGSDDVRVHLDVPRTWAFVEALLSDPGIAINRIYVVEHVRTMLLEHARETKAPKAIIELFGHVTCQPRFPHDDHMHIRAFCTPEDIANGCLDTKPIYPWHATALREAGAKPVIAGPPKKASKLTSVKEAREKAAQKQELHPEVVAFLDRRTAWAKKPRSGRKYCK